MYNNRLLLESHQCSDETNVTIFYYLCLYDKYNVLIMVGNVNAQTGKDENSKCCLHNVSK